MSEGVRRVAVALRFVGLAGAVAWLAVGAGLMLSGEEFKGLVAVYLVGVAVLIAGAGWGLGWIVEGFAKK